MSDTARVAPASLREGDAIDLSPLFDDPRADFWAWEPFGSDAQSRRTVVEQARGIADCAYAVVESVQALDGRVVVYNDQLNVTVAEDCQIERVIP